MENFSNAHAGLQISTHHSLPSAVPFTIQVQMIGCNACLKKAIIELLVHNTEFRLLINECGRAANEIRKADRRPGPDSTLN